MRILIVILVMLVLGVTACSGFSKADIPSFTIVSGSGKAATETRNVSNFNRIALADDGTLVLSQSGSESLMVEADDNVLSAIETYVENGTLHIEIKDSTDVRPVTPIRYLLSVSQIEEIQLIGDGKIEVSSLESNNLALNLRGDGRITIDSLVAQKLDAVINGDGRIIVAGEVSSQALDIRGDGNFTASELQSDSATVKVNGDGQISIWVIDTLDADVSGDAVVSYFGSPQVQEDVSGDARLVNADN